MIQAGNTRPHLSPNIPPRLSRTLGQLEDRYTRDIRNMMSTGRLNFEQKREKVRPHQECTENVSIITIFFQ